MTRQYNYTTPDAHVFTGAMREAIFTDEFIDSPLSTAILGKGTYLDLREAVHVLIAGTTGSGKSVMLHNIITSLLIRNTPNTAEFLLIDPKIIEFEYFYKDSPLLFCPVVTDPEEALKQLQRASEEMMNRYEVLRSSGKRFWTGKKLYIVIDEIADLVSAGGKCLENIIEKIARLGRGAGVHLIVATQHPTGKVLSRQITTNLDTRICLKVKDGYASRLVLGTNGGERLRGKGHAILCLNGDFTYFQSAYISDEELEAFCRSWKVEEIPEEKPIKIINLKTTISKILSA